MAFPHLLPHTIAVSFENVPIFFFFLIQSPYKLKRKAEAATGAVMEYLNIYISIIPGS